MASLSSHNGGALESFELIPDQPLESDPSNLQRELLSATFDLNGEEIQRRLLELAEDNIALKESLRHSTDVMRNDLCAITSWHNNITTTIARQEIALQEANDRIKELLGEKERLEARVKEAEKPAEEASLKVDNANPSDEEEFVIVQKKSKAAAELKEAEVQIVKLNQEVEAQNLKIKSLTAMYEESEKERDLLKSQLANEEELKAQVASLQQQVLDLQQLNSGLKGKVEALEREEPGASDAQVTELHDRIVQLEEKLAWEERATEAERVKHNEARKLLSVTESNYERVTKILQLQSRSQKEKAECELEARRTLEQVDGLTARLLHLEQQLEEREGKLLALHSELGMQKEEAAALPVLKAQVEVFKIDLDNAVLAKEAAQEEVLQLSQQLRDTQQAAAFCTHCGAGNAHGESTSRGRGARRRTHSNRQPESVRLDGDLFVCPVCQFGFTELQALENHVNNCIDKSQH